MEETKKVGKISQTAKSVLVSIAAIGGLIGLIFLFVNLSQYKSDKNIYMFLRGFQTYHTHDGYSAYLESEGWVVRYRRDFFELPYIYIAFAFFFLTLLFLLVYLLLYKMQIEVTNKRVSGKTYFGKTVDLPLDSVSAVGSTWPKGISVASSSGKISFLLIENAKEIHQEIRSLLIARQDKIQQAQASTSATNNPIEELKQYKELCDGGIITQEEFEQKKKQLLGLK